MGNRESLLDGARKCLEAKGFGQTTVRDITEAAGGVSMAAIGYHFGSKEALLTEALVQMTEAWGEEVERALDVPASAEAAPSQFAASWDRLMRAALSHRSLWAVTFEVIASTDTLPDVRERILAGLEKARHGLVESLGDPHDGQRQGSSWVIGSLYQALLTGLVAQLLIDPDHAISGEELARGLTEIGRHCAE